MDDATGRRILQELELLRNRLDKVNGRLDDFFYILEERIHTPVNVVNIASREEPVRVEPEFREPAMSEHMQFPGRPIMAPPPVAFKPIVPGLKHENLRIGNSATLDTANVLIEDRDIHGGLIIRGPGAVIRNCRFTGDGSSWNAILTEGNGSVLLEHCEITGEYITAGFAGNNIELLNCRLTGLKKHGGEIGNNVVLDNCFIGDFEGEDVHDGLRILKPVGAVSIIKCEIRVPADMGNSALIFSAQKDGVPDPSPIHVRGNKLGGGAYTVAFDDGGEGGEFGVMHFCDNTFTQDALWNAVYPNGYVAKEWTGNSYEDGSPLG